jgi:hypothetical protein
MQIVRLLLLVQRPKLLLLLLLQTVVKPLLLPLASRRRRRILPTLLLLQPPPPSRPFTRLYCEPIGNVAVQLAGARQWTLLDPQHSHLLQPSVSPDSRVFFASWASWHQVESVPRYQAIRTLPGDAVWFPTLFPTWTWHRVDYVVMTEAEKERVGLLVRVKDEDAHSVAIGASLFHFRPLDFFRRNPLYAMLLLPYLIGELLGSKSQ